MSIHVSKSKILISHNESSVDDYCFISLRWNSVRAPAYPSGRKSFTMAEVLQVEIFGLYKQSGVGILPDTDWSVGTMFVGRYQGDAEVLKYGTCWTSTSGFRDAR